MSFPPPNTYYLAGLRIVSEIALPGLMACADQIGPSVSIRRARLPETLSSVTAVFPEGQCNENELLFNIPDAARYLIRSGSEILVDQAANSNPGDVAAYLLGTAFGVLCHQRGTTPLHGSAIDIVDGCVAFVGDSGAGKSTMVAALASRGHQVISDDLCVFEASEQGVRVWPGLNRLRLWEDALAALDCDQPGIEREFRGLNKYLVPTQPIRNPRESTSLATCLSTRCCCGRRSHDHHSLARSGERRSSHAKHLPRRDGGAHGSQSEAFCCLRSSGARRSCLPLEPTVRLSDLA